MTATSKFINSIDALKIGFIYSAVWVDHEREGRKVRCYRIISIDPTTGLVRTDLGNRTFSKLMWFNEQAGTL